MELQELALRIRRGDREALKTLISEYGVSVYQKAYQKTQDKNLAREATRQTFAQLVTSLQEQSDMDGWELWLNALAKKNIDTYCNIGADMAYLENQLNTELFAPTGTAPRAAGKSADTASDAAKQFALQQQRLAQQAAQQRQYEAQLAQQQAQQQYEAQQLAQRQYEAQLAQQQARQQHEAQQLAQRQYEAQLAQQQARQQHEAQLAAEQAASQPQLPQPPAADEVAAPQRPPQPANPVLSALDLETPPPRGRKAKREERLHARRKHTDGPVIVLLVLLCAALVWLVVGVAMSLNWLPSYDLGYEWFNQHILDLF